MKVRFALIVVAALALAATPVWSQDICQTMPGNQLVNCV